MVALILAASSADAPALLRAQSAEGSTYAVVITGLGGDPDYEKIIDGWGKDLHAALEKSGVGKDRLFWLAAKKQEGVHAVSQADQITGLLGTLAQRMTADDAFQLYLIGHGSFDDFDYKFNIPGPDLTAGQFADLLNALKPGRQLVVSMTSASGAALESWRKPGRVVITSTSAGQERNFSVFARYFVAALQETAADTDKNDAVSALEAFRYGTQELTRYYESQKRLATEHPMIEDKGDGEGVREATAENGQGLLAGATVVRRFAATQATLDTPEARQLRARKRQVEESIERLKYQKASMQTETYLTQLERLLVDLAQVQRSLDALEKAAPGPAAPQPPEPRP
jgi:hypothetical protein